MRRKTHWHDGQNHTSPDELVQSTPLLERNIEADDVHPLRLNKTLLLEKLRQAKAAESISNLRIQIKELQACLYGSNGTMHANGTDENTVTFTHTFLKSELEQITSARTYERAGYYIDRLIKSISEIKTSEVNDINLYRWKEYNEIYTDSLWVIDRRDNSGAHKAEYWGNFVPQIPHQMMLRYTRKGDWVLDTFAGLGTTLIEGKRLGRNTLGVELQAAVAEQGRQRIANEPDIYGATVELITDDSVTVDYAALLHRYGQRTAQLVIMHPPYFDIIKFSNDPRDLSNAPSVTDFVTKVGAIATSVAAVLERKRYLVLVIGDKYARGEWIPLGFLAMNKIMQHGFSLKSIIVKNFEETTGKRQQKELWRYRALVNGFYIFKHEYIFLFKKK